MKFNLILANITLSLILLMGTFALAMEKSTLTTKEKLLGLVKMYSHEPITFIPQYVYENCNQVTRYNWDKETFLKLKSKVGMLTKEGVRTKYSGDQFIKNAEGYDWIYGLHYLESEFIKKGKDLADTLTVDEVKFINGKFCRLIVDNPGEFRKTGISWKAKPFSVTEHVFHEIFDNTDYGSLFTGENPFGLRFANHCIITEGVGDGCSRFVDNPELSVNTIKSALKEARTFIFLNKQTGLPLNIDLSKISLAEVDDWEKEARGSKKGFIDFKKWAKPRNHFFPKPEDIEQEVKLTLKSVKDIKHPIEKAARIWYDMVRIHISHEANKRTGKALASIILLQNGYLPPLITLEYEREYIECIIKALMKPADEGFEDFLKFVVKMILTTQHQFKDSFPV